MTKTQYGLLALFTCLSLEWAGCAPIDVDPATDADEEAEIEGTEQAVTTDPCVHYILTGLASMTPSSWGYVGYVWGLSNVNANGLCTFTPASNGAPGKLIREFPRSYNCFLTGNKAFNCAGQYISCPNAKITRPYQRWYTNQPSVPFDSNGYNTLPTNEYMHSNLSPWYAQIVNTTDPNTVRLECAYDFYSRYMTYDRW